MSNRLIGILIIIGFMGAGYLYYSLSYLPEKEFKVKQEQELKNSLVEEVKEPELIKQVVDKVKLSNAQKIENIKDRIKKYMSFDLEFSRKAYFLKNNNTLDLYLDTKKIGNFELVYPEYLRVEFVKGSESDLYIEVGADKFYYNNKTNTVSEIELNIGIEYVKNGLDNTLIFVTTKGSFIYSIYNKSLNYFSYFNDFVYFNDGYIGLVKKEEKRILNNLGINTEFNNIVIYYNSDTKEKKIIYSTDLNIKYIYVLFNKVYIVDSEGELFELENL